jgi:hypothetical protein
MGWRRPDGSCRPGTTSEQRQPRLSIFLRLKNANPQASQSKEGIVQHASIAATCAFSPARFKESYEIDLRLICA